MAGKFSLDGAMIPRSVRRDVRRARRAARAGRFADRRSAHRGRNHVVKVLNLSNSGAMVIFPHLPHIGEAVSLQLLDWGQVHGHIRWARDGKIGINFAAALE